MYTQAGFETTIVGFLNSVRTRELETVARQESGLWYEHSTRFAANVASTYGLTVYQAAGIVAAFSIRTRWENNMADVVQFMETGDVPGLRLRVNKARAILNCDGSAQAVNAVLNGPKTQRFARNIAGDTDSVTIDVWMCRLLGMEHKHAKGGNYDKAEQAVRTVAATVGMTPATFQAYLWILIRGNAY